MTRGDWIGAGLATLAILTAVVAGATGYLDGAAASNIVLAVTALIILVYTLETARLRRDAETRTTRESQPVVRFAITNPTRPDGIPQILAHGTTPQDGEYVLRSFVKNESPNPGIGRLRVRLAHSGRVASASEDAYNGTRDWEIGPYFHLYGTFSLSALVRAVLPAGQQEWPSDGMTLSVQMELYEAGTRKLIWSTSKEYFVKHREGTFEFWPHISAEVLQPLDVIDRLPPRNR